MNSMSRRSRPSQTPLGFILVDGAGYCAPKLHPLDKPTASSPPAFLSRLANSPMFSDFASLQDVRTSSQVYRRSGVDFLDNSRRA